MPQGTGKIGNMLMPGTKETACTMSRLVGLRKLARAGSFSAHDTVVCVVTGTGFKDIRTVRGCLDMHEIPVIPPRLDELMSIFGRS
jgi:threonine synthase